MKTIFACSLSSSKLSHDDFVLVVEACLAQLVDDFAPAWERTPPLVILGGPQSSPPDERVVPAYFRDKTPNDPDGALAYHWVNPDTKEPEVVVLVDTILSQEGATRDDISCGAGHEFIETEGDLFANDWSDRGDGYEEPKELCDRVQGGSYQKTVKKSDGTAETVRVTNFLLPPAFDDEAPAGSKFDFLGALKTAREIAPGGYTVARKAGTNEQEVFGNQRAALAFSIKTLEHHEVDVPKIRAALARPHNPNTNDEPTEETKS